MRRLRSIRDSFVVRVVAFHLQVASGRLVHFDGLEQRFEVASSETLFIQFNFNTFSTWIKILIHSFDQSFFLLWISW